MYFAYLLPSLYSGNSLEHQLTLCLGHLVIVIPNSTDYKLLVKNAFRVYPMGLSLITTLDYHVTNFMALIEKSKLLPLR